MAQLDSRTIAIRDILTRLCKRSGLSRERLHTTEIDITVLVSLPVIRRAARRTHSNAIDVVIPVIGDLVGHLPATHRIIADAELSLGQFADHEDAGIDPRRLYAPDLGERRQYLTEHWQQLHHAAGVSAPTAAPTVRSLRATPERRAFTALAALLITGAPSSQPISLRAPTPDTEEIGVVTVLGDAAVDHIYHVDSIPAPGTSTPGTYTERLGGRGLYRAVAAARLGLTVRLVATVGDDDAGQRILDYLHEEKIDTELVEVVSGSPTPITSVMVTDTGIAGTIGCKSDLIRLAERTVDQQEITRALADSDAVLLSFEQSSTVLEHVLATVRALDTPPWLIVHPSPPVPAPQSLYQQLGAVDYMVGGLWELDEMVPEVSATSRTHIAHQLRALGVRTVCVVEDFACTVRSEHGNIDIARLPAALTDSPGARSCFAAALAYRLISSGRPAEEPDYLWATAAMVATQTFGDVAGAMPVHTEIERLVRLTRNSG